MAYIGLYGVYYAKANLDGNGAVTGYNGVQTMGKAIAANFTPNEGTDNPLYANNGIAEKDSATGAGGTLTLTLDRLKADAIADLFGLTKKTEAVTVGTESVSGTGFDFTTEDAANTVGVAFIRQKQEDNSRGYHEAVIFYAATFGLPAEDAQTLGEQIEWQTPEIEGSVTTNTGTYPWCKKYTFPTQEAAITFITQEFAASAVTT